MEGCSDEQVERVEVAYRDAPHYKILLLVQLKEVFFAFVII